MKAGLAKLSPEDQRLAAAQGYCPILEENPLGKMGPPVQEGIARRLGFGSMTVPSRMQAALM